ncbi:hypothetical protein ID866_12991 [Astraeus odoratus]|nr:hypothetical protein ID866_12991 [Astraeus odoratus]
MAFLRFRPP